MRDYHINIFYSQDDEGYIADIPDLEFCSAFGESPMQALQELEIAKALWLEAACAEGKTIPSPKYQPMIYQALALSEVFQPNDNDGMQRALAPSPPRPIAPHPLATALLRFCPLLPRMRAHSISHCPSFAATLPAYRLICRQ